MEAPSWKQQLAVASLVAIFAGFVVRLLIPGYFTAAGLPAAAPFGVASFAVYAAFFLPFLWWRSPIGYIGAVIVGIIALVGQLAQAGPLVEAAVESYIVIIPHIVFALLLIGASVLAWRDG